MIQQRVREGVGGVGGKEGRREGVTSGMTVVRRPKDPLIYTNREETRWVFTGPLCENTT